MIGRTRIFVAVLAIACRWGEALAAEAAATELDHGLALPTVITPTRLKQSFQEVPVSVTALTAKTLRTYGVTTIADALRLVPGMAVTQATGNLIQVNYHGTNARDPRRMNVLINGISVYRPGLSEIDWAHLPIAIEDVERIEVTRGPASAAYGPNSMTAVVNIITKNPSDADEASFAVGGGTNQRYRVHGSAAFTIADTSLLVSASSEGDGGYDKINGRADREDSSTARRLMLRSRTQLTEGTALSLDGAYVEGTSKVPFRSEFEAPPNKAHQDYYMGAALTSTLSKAHERQVRVTYSRHRIEQRWATCFPAVAFLPELYTLYGANIDYANTLLAGRMPSGGTRDDDLLALRAAAAIRRLGPAGLTPLCGLANQDVVQQRIDAELQETYAWNDSLRFVGGIGARQVLAESQTFLGGKASNEMYRVFGNAEYKPTAWATVNLGGYAEHDKLVGWTYSSRAAINLQVDPNQGVRLALSTGTRTPDLQEQKGNYSFVAQLFAPLPDGSTTARFYQHSASRGGLKEEMLHSQELGYFLNVPKWGLLFDAKVFDDRLTDLISEPISIATVSQTNNNSVRLRGLELQVSASLGPDLSGFATFAYLSNTGATNPIERSQYSRYSGSLGLAKALGSGWGVSGAYYGSSGDGANNRYGRLDVTLSKSFMITQRQAEATVRLTSLETPDVAYLAGLSPARSHYNDRLLAYVGLKISL